MDPYFLISVTILATVAFFSVLLLTIVFMRMRRQMNENHIRRRREILEPRILEYGREKDATVQDYLAGVQIAGDEEPLRRILMDHIRVVRGTVRERLVRACEELGLVQHALRLLESSQAWVRGAAAEDLGRMRSETSVEPLVQAMGDPSSDVRMRAAQSLGVIGGRAAASHLVGFFHQPDRWSGIRIADILTTMGEETVDELLREFHNIPAASRTLAIDVLGRVRSLSAVPLLRELLRDENADVRARSADALGQIGDPNNASLLMDALEDDSWQVRAIAAKALGRLPGTGSLDALCRALTDAQWWVRANAAESIKAKGEPGHKALLDMLDSNDVYAREQAVFMLEESGVLDAYLDQLGSKHDEDRVRAVNFINKLVSLERTDRLTEAARMHPDRNVRDDLLDLLGISPAGLGGST